MKNDPTHLSCPAAPHPELAHLFFPLIALTLLLFAWPDLADAKRMGGEGSFGSKPSYNSGYNKPTPSAKDSPAMAQQAAPNAPSRCGSLIRPSRWNGSVKPSMHKLDVSSAPYKPSLA